MKKTIILLLTVTTLPSMANENISAIKSIALVAVKKDSTQYVRICNAADNKCGIETKIWQDKGLNDVFYLTNSSLELIKIKNNNGAYVNEGLWRFDEKNKSTSPDEELNKEGLYIYPALYPLSKSKQAVALVSKWATSYSGGGREEEYADFVMINNDGSYETVFKNIPFSSKEMIRACFSEADYAKTSHCHDENWSILNLKFIDDGKKYYSWKFTTKSYNWPAFTDKSSTSVTVDENVAYPFQSQPHSSE
ncbi:hypothetical protein SJI19_10600 [Acerihabitans sp. TG2]|uniref:hypothetical protein n=1 Tax=Acerihabitans sp. TG2 TaxID=3096008 RepID=UPI002B23C1C5|nr:hypothetical protein [Acerihabitans sp. TG2]MEA9390989.1 hypothetical protein [Acerihabitans sp. TG2]